MLEMQLPTEFRLGCVIKGGGYSPLAKVAIRVTSGLQSRRSAKPV
jgi:hypothetical protein